MRLPLASLTVATPRAAQLEPFTGLIADEVNVKQVQLTGDVSAHSTQVLTVVPRVLGPRVGAAVQQVIKAVKAGEWELVDGAPVAAGVNACERGALVLPATVTKRLTVCAGLQFMSGTTICSDVGVTEVTEAATPPTCTMFSPAVPPNLVPVIVATCPSRSVLGEMAVICGASSGLPAETVSCAETVRRIVPKDSRVIIGTTAVAVDDGVQNNYQEPVIFFYSRRYGWSLPQDWQTPERIESYRRAGGRFLIMPNESLAQASPELVRYLGDRARAISAAPFRRGPGRDSPAEHEGAPPILAFGRRGGVHEMLDEIFRRLLAFSNDDAPGSG